MQVRLKYSIPSLTRLVAEKVFIHQKLDLNWSMLHYFCLKLLHVGINFIAASTYIYNMWLAV